MKKRNILALVLALSLVVGLLAGCGGDGGSGDNAPSTAPTESSGAPSTESGGEPSADFTPVAVPEVPDLGGMTANEWLVSRTDKKALGGVIPTHLESRADVYKGLDQVDLNDDHVVVGWLSASLGSDFFTERERSAKEACEKYGYEFINFDANFDLTTQTEQLENILTMDIDFLMINATDIDALSIYYTQAAEMGIPVFCTGPSSAQDSYNIVTTVLSGSWETGFKDGEYTCEALWGQFPEGLNVGSLIAKVGDSDSESRVCGFISGYLSKYAELAGTPYDTKWDAGVIGYNTWLELRDKGSASIDGILNMLGYVTTNGIDPSTAAPAAAELLTAYPTMDLIVCETGSFGTSIINECIQAGYKPGEDIYIIYCADGEGYVNDYIMTGEVLCQGTNLPYPCGEDVIELIHDIMNGFDANDLPANSYTPTYVITKDNVEQVYTPGDKFAVSLEPWKIMTTEEYNAANAG